MQSSIDRTQMFSDPIKSEARIRLHRDGGDRNVRNKISELIMLRTAQSNLIELRLIVWRKVVSWLSIGEVHRFNSMIVIFKY